MSELPEIPEVQISEESKKIEELTNVLTNLEFFSNQVTFNINIFNKLNNIIERLDQIEKGKSA